MQDNQEKRLEEFKKRTKPILEEYNNKIRELHKRLDAERRGKDAGVREEKELRLEMESKIKKIAEEMSTE